MNILQNLPHIVLIDIYNPMVAKLDKQDIWCGLDNRRQLVGGRSRLCR